MKNLQQNISFLILFLISTFVFSQNKRFIYDYKFVLDSTKQDKAETEQMYLDVAAKGSKYYSRNFFVSDSITNAEIQKQMNSLSNNIKFPEVPNAGKIKYVVEKYYPNYDMLFFNSVDSENYKVLDNRQISWIISPEKDKIGIWEVQKATSKMYGRNWTAWFCSDLPFQDGPYKFHGLPGLIVKISDQSNSHIFELRGIKSLLTNEEWISNEKGRRYNQLITIDEKKYKKVVQSYVNDPLKHLKLKLSSGTFKIESRDASGRVLSQNETLRSQEKQAKENIAKNNNYLELDLLK